MRARLTGLHKATKRLSGGRIAVYAYAGRGRALVARGEGRTLAEANTALEIALGKPDALQRVQDARKVIRVREDRAYVTGLIAAFKGSPEWEKIGATSKREYSRYLDRFKAEFGDWKVSIFEQPSAKVDLLDWRDEWSDTPRAADYAMQSVGRLFKWARGRGLTSARPTDDIERLYDSDRSDIIWSDDDITALLRHASPEIALAVRFAAEVGLRTGDLIALPWSAVSANGIVWRTGKKKRQAVIPLTPKAKAVLKEMPRKGPIVLTNEDGRPWTPDAFKKRFRKAKAAAGLDRLHFHDIRGTAATRLYIAGVQKRDLALIFAWKEETVDALLTKYVSGDAVALDLLSRMNQKPATQTGDKPGSGQSE